MWRIRLFGKIDKYAGKKYTQEDLDNDTSDQWTSIYSISLNETYDDADIATVQTTKDLNVDDNVIIAYSDTIALFGIIIDKQVITDGAQYQYKVSDFLHKLSKYTIPRHGVDNYYKLMKSQVGTNTSASNDSHPAGKFTISQLLDIILLGAGSSWTHKCKDFYYLNSGKDDVLGPFYRWSFKYPPTEGEYLYNRWYNIPDFRQLPYPYGQLPTAPNYFLKYKNDYLAKAYEEFEYEQDAYDQVYYLPCPYSTDEIRAESKDVKEYIESTIKYIPTLNMTNATVLNVLRRLMVDLMKMNLWVEYSYKPPKKASSTTIPLDPPDDYDIYPESIDYVSFILCYADVSDHKMDPSIYTINYISLNVLNSSFDRKVDMVKLYNKDRTICGTAITPPRKYTDAGKLISAEDISLPFISLMYEYSDGRNEKELIALANELLEDYTRDKLRINITYPPGITDDARFMVGDIIKVRSDSFVSMHIQSGWIKDDDPTYLKEQWADREQFYRRRMENLCDNSNIYLSEDRDEMLLQIKDITYTLENTIVGVEEKSTSIFDIMEDRIKRIDGTDDEVSTLTYTPLYDSGDVTKQDVSLISSSGESPCVADSGVVKYINILSDIETPPEQILDKNYKLWDGISWSELKEFATDAGYPPWTKLVIPIPPEDGVSAFPNSRGLVPISYIGPWFNLEINVFGNEPDLEPILQSDSWDDYKIGYPGSGWMIPMQEDVADGITIVADEQKLTEAITKGEYTPPDEDCEIPPEYKNILYYKREVDCAIEYGLIDNYYLTTGQVLNPSKYAPYLKIGPIPKGFETVSITTVLYFDKYVHRPYTVESWNGNESILTISANWCFEQAKRPKSGVFSRSLEGYYDYSNSDWYSLSSYGGNWHSTILTGISWSATTDGAGYAYMATITWTLSDKSVAYLETGSFYFRLAAVYNYFAKYDAAGYRFMNLHKWQSTATITPGYELLEEWYASEKQKLQLLIKGKQILKKKSASSDEYSSIGYPSTIVDWPSFQNDDGYWVFNIKQFLQEGDIEVYIRSIQEIFGSGVYEPARIKLRGSYISGWINDS